MGASPGKYNSYSVIDCSPTVKHPELRKSSQAEALAVVESLRSLHGTTVHLGDLQKHLTPDLVDDQTVLRLLRVQVNGKIICDIRFTL